MTSETTKKLSEFAPRRWRLVRCFMQGSKEVREKLATDYIKHLASCGFKSRVFAPLPEHQNSGHTHIIALCNLRQKLRIGGVESYV